MNFSKTVSKLVYMCKDYTFSIVVRRLSSFPVLEYLSSTKRLTVVNSKVFLNEIAFCWLINAFCYKMSCFLLLLLCNIMLQMLCCFAFHYGTTYIMLCCDALCHSDLRWYAISWQNDTLRELLLYYVMFYASIDVTEYHSKYLSLLRCDSRIEVIF